MLSDQLLKGLNEQLNFEFQSANIYMAMAAYCSHQNYDGFANFFLVQAEEERYHAMKFYNFINDRGKRVIITGSESPNNDFKSLRHVFEEAYKHEQEVTKRIYTLSDIAMDEREQSNF